MKRRFMLLTAVIIFTMACNFLFPTPTPAPSLPESPAPQSEAPAAGDGIAAKLEELGGAPCEENPDFTCISIQVPLDHFDPANAETLEVFFAVSPATGERMGMFVQAFPGGPGGEGISTGGMGWFSEGIIEHYDIVYFDQRGIGLSNPLACPQTYAADYIEYLTERDQAGEEGYDTAEEQKAAIEGSRKYVEDCVAEMGIEPAKLAFFGTNQVAEDLEAFRQVIGDEKFMLYGVSYGTAVAQTYAAAYPEHLSGLILDGTIDMTLSGVEGAFAQEKAFDKVLLAALEACNDDEYCADDMGGDAVAVYDKFAKQLSEKPLAYEFPLPSGKKVQREFTFNQWESVAAYQMYSLGGRMLYLRALAAANRGDIIPMARLAYQQLTVDPESFAYLGDDTFSDTMFLSVLCTDDAFFSGTQEEKTAQTIEAGQASNGTVPRIDGSIYTGLDCAFWPSSPETAQPAAPLKAEGVPTFVLNATLDPATPFEEGKAVFENLADGYHLYVEGGGHSIYGWGYDCPDQYISDFMVDGTLPDEREIVCEGWNATAIRAYEPLALENASDYEDPLQIFYAIDGEIQFQAEYYYNSFIEDVSVACPFGGSFTFGPSDAGETYTFDKCEYVKGFALSGSGGYEYESGIMTIDAQVTGDKEGNLSYTNNYAEDKIAVSGEYGGKTIDLAD